MSGAELCRGPVLERADHLGDRRTCRVRFQARHVRGGDQLHVVVRQRRIDADDLCVRFRVDKARESVDPVAPNADRVVQRQTAVVLRQVDPDRKVKGVQALLHEVVAELLDSWLVLHRGVCVLGACRPLRGVLPMAAMHEVQMLGLRVVGLRLVAPDRPRGRDPVVMSVNSPSFVLMLIVLSGADTSCAASLWRMLW